MQIINALFDERTEAEKALQALINNEFDPSDISLISQGEDGEISPLLDENDKKRGILKGAAAGTGVGVIGGLALMVIPGVGPVTALGWLAATLGGGVAGGALGAFTGNMAEVMSKAGIDPDQAEFYAEAVRRGGSLLTLRVDDRQANNARALLADFNKVDADQRLSDYRTEGWERFDIENSPFTQEQIAKERNRNAKRERCEDALSH